MRLRLLIPLLGCLPALTGCSAAPRSAADAGSGPTAAPMPGSAPKTPHRFTTTEIGTATVQDVRDVALHFDFTPDDGPTLAKLRVRTAEIDGLRDTLLEPGTRLRLRLVREFLPLGTATPREISRRWEALRTR